MSAIMLYTLAAAAMISTLIATVLNGLAYASLQSLPSHRSAFGLAPVSLGAISCVALVVLSLLLHKDIRGDYQWAGWKIGVFYFTGAYLVIAALSTAGTMTTNELPSTLWIARSVFWAASILTQGLYYGFLLMKPSQKKSYPTWPRSYSQTLKPLPEAPSSSPPPPQPAYDPYPRVEGFDTRRSSLRKFPRRSNRYSGGTICIQSFKESMHNSFDTNSSTISSPEPSPTTDRMPDTFADRDTRPLLRGDGSVRSMPSLRQEPKVQLSLDTLVQTSSPTASTFHLDHPTESTTNLSDGREHNIHPLFRSTSPSPSPTPTPGTMVKASPSAGQTITKKTLTRMKSARSFREHTMRTPSPLPSTELGDQTLVHKGSDSGLSFLHAGHIRRSMTQYKKRYGLNESPDEH